MKELRTLYPEIPANFTKMMKADDTRVDVILTLKRIELFCLINVEVGNLHHMLV